jgi:hypothetical protein
MLLCTLLDTIIIIIKKKKKKLESAYTHALLACFEAIDWCELVKLAL